MGWLVNLAIAPNITPTKHTKMEITEEKVKQYFPGSDWEISPTYAQALIPFGFVLRIRAYPHGCQAEIITSHQILFRSTNYQGQSLDDALKSAHSWLKENSLKTLELLGHQQKKIWTPSFIV